MLLVLLLLAAACLLDPIGSQIDSKDRRSLKTCVLRRNSLSDFRSFIFRARLLNGAISRLRFLFGSYRLIITSTHTKSLCLIGD